VVKGVAFWIACVLCSAGPGAAQSADPAQDEGFWTGWLGEAKAALETIDRDFGDFRLRAVEYLGLVRERMLSSGGSTEGSYYPPEKSALRFAAIDRAMADPFVMARYAHVIHAGLRGAGQPLSKVVRFAYGFTGDITLPDALPPAPTPEAGANPFVWIYRVTGAPLPGYVLASQRQAWKSIPEPLRGPLTQLIAESFHALVVRTEAFSKCDEAALAVLAAGPPAGTEGTVRHIRAVEQVDMAKLWLAGVLAAEAAERALATLAALGPDVDVPRTLIVETPHGEIIIGSRGADLHTRDAWLIVELGGDDVYANNAGGVSRAAAGVAICLDLGGDDVYSSGREFVQGAAYAGVGILIDVAGDDRYLAGNHAQGVGVLGVGLLRDLDGRDVYRGESMVQGAGWFGVGIVNDTAGNDRYAASSYAQGEGRIMGLGLCADLDGDDAYRAGGRFRDTSRHGSSFLSQGQGHAEGLYLRTIENGKTTRIAGIYPGGIGILYDRLGDDAYEGGVFCQGSSYCFALGMLVDAAGNDSYTGYWYAQGNCAHYAVAGCFDASGDDVYRARYQAQGNGRDFSAALFFDGAGNDRYRSEDRSLGAGDLRGGFGVFVDRGGDDAYEYGAASLGYGTPGAGLPEPGPPEYLSLGVFLDLGGRDLYKAGTPQAGDAHADGLVRPRAGSGVAVDK